MPTKLEKARHQRWAARTLQEVAPNGVLPGELRDVVVQRSRNGVLGQVKVKRFTGVVPSGTTRLLKKFEAQAGGIMQVGLALAAAPNLPVSLQTVVDMIADPATSRKGLARIVAAAQVDPAVVISTYTRGVMALGHANTIAEIVKDLPRVGRQLVREALPKRAICRSCFGTKVITPRGGGKEYPCIMCQGAGEMEELGEHFEYASSKLFELAGLTSKAGGVNVAVGVNQTNTTQVNMGSELLERLTAVSDSVVHNTKAAVEAEVVSKE